MPQFSVEKRTILESVRRLNTWHRGEERAPHKPLLLLLALARVANHSGRLTSFEEIEPRLRALLEEFGPPRISVHPEYPFWRLQSDGLWEVVESHSLTRRKSNSDPLKSELLKYHICGGFPAPIYEALKRDTALRAQLATEILNAHFPSSIHEDILQAVGLAIDVVTVPGPRSPLFRESVLRAYDHACAVCGYSVRLGNSDMGLEAAHIKWHQAGGSDEVSNGLACCTVHHRALDRGAIGVSTDLRILVSSDLHGAGKLQEWFLSLAGKFLREPNIAGLAPAVSAVDWHRREVFRDPARDCGA
ncbi:MAG TPA: HNH endonuclease [Armatimonadota bacterium]|jgi:putative restriction endonuclease